MKIAVLFGGDSAERDVSVASCGQVVNALRSRAHDVVAVDTETGPLTEQEEGEVFARGIDRQPPEPTAASHLPIVVAALADADFDLVFLALHGGSGENGTVQSLLDIHGIRYTGSGRDVSAARWRGTRGSPSGCSRSRRFRRPSGAWRRLTPRWSRGISGSR